MNIEIKQDLGCRYLVVEAEEGQPDFRIQMLVHQTIKALLPCRTRRINGTLLLAYDIGGKQSLQELCAGQTVGYDILRALFQTLYAAGTHMREYLLEMDMLLLSPEFVFYEPDERTFFFCCIPQMAAHEGNQLHSLCRFLLEVLDHTDQKAVQLGYQMYRGSMDEGMGAADVWQQLLPHMEDGTMTAAAPQESAMPKDGSMPQESAVQQDGPMPQEGFMPQEDPVLQEDLVLQEAALQDQKGRTKTAAYEPHMGRGSLENATTGDAAWGGSEQPHSDRTSIRGGKHSDKKKKKPEKDGKPEKRRGSFLKNLFAGSEPLPAYAGEKLFSYGEKGCMLRGCEKGLPMFQPSVSPFLIGSLEFAVDGFIDDVTVSRFHAKLEKRADGYYLTDLDSAHGTQINQVALTPQRQVRLNDGDEVCFGKTRFQFSS